MLIAAGVWACKSLGMQDVARARGHFFVPSKLNRGVEPGIRVSPDKNPPRADMDQINAVSGDNRPAISAVNAIDSSQTLSGSLQCLINNPLRESRAENSISGQKNSYKQSGSCNYQKEPEICADGIYRREHKPVEHRQKQHCQNGHDYL
jgi:hypothetical protein